MSDNKKRDEKVQLDRLEESIRAAVANIISTVFEEKNLTKASPTETKNKENKNSGHDAISVAGQDGRRQLSDDFWELGPVKPRSYKKPDFADSPVPMTDIADESGERGAYLTADIEAEAPQPEKIGRPDEPRAVPDNQRPHRAADNTAPYMPTELLDKSKSSDLSDSADSSNSSDSTGLPKSDGITTTDVEYESTHTAITQDGRQTVVADSPRYQLGTYRRHGRAALADRMKKHREDTADRMKKRAVEPESRKYSPGGLLIREIEVKSWESDVDFYSRFTENAAANHNAKPSVPYTESYPPVKYFSYVPQYSHMSRSQLDYYRWVRENIRHGRFPSCDSTYIQLYIYEILNLPDLIPPEVGVRELAAIWLAYRRTEPRLDGYLCEWLPDYCMIHGCPMPEALCRILPEIVPKAQFKEFFFDAAAKSRDSSGRELIARTLIENSSDYDYRRSRYYAANKEDYELHITQAAAHAVANSIDAGRGIFALDRTYRMVRDSYCGAIVSADAKRRLGIEFLSFTRSAEARRAVTAVVKYSENKLRAMLGIKSKLSVDGLAAEDLAAIDEYFAPHIPEKHVKAKEDRYMPEDYLKNYESDDHGFDFAAASEIERQSWQNTALLTSDDTDTEAPSPERQSADRNENDQTDADSASTPCGLPEKIPTEADAKADVTPNETHETHDITDDTYSTDGTDSTDDGDAEIIKSALQASLDGCFHRFCLDRRVYDGELADKINTLFIDIIGDVVLEPGSEGNDGSFKLIEDYREDVEQWLNS